MKPNRAKQLILGLFAAVMLMTGVLATSAEAQTRRNRPRRVIIYRPYYVYNPFYDPFYDPFWGYSYRTIDPVAYQQDMGFSKGKKEGEKAAKNGIVVNSKENREYTKSDILVFREAFVKGYEDGYREELADLREKGLKEGRDEGKDDAKDGKPANPTVNKDYLKYSSPVYRQAFVQGYHERYQQEMRGNNN